MDLFAKRASAKLRVFTHVASLCAVALFAPVSAWATLTVTPITWNTVGLDSNDPSTGPNNFPVGARVCSNVATTNVAVNFVFDSANANINLRAGSLSTINFAAIGAGNCSDAYFEAQVTRTPAAYDTTRRYHITATDVSGTASTPTPRELYVEHLISQSRNSINDVKVGNSIGTLVSVPAGGSMDLIVGNTYYIQLLGGTATQGYEQFEQFINFSNTIFQILSVSTTYSADNSPYVPNPNDKLYADACLWQNDPNSPIYRSCGGGDFNAGGNSVVTTYQIKIIGGGGTSQTLSTLLYDFSGSSFHYNGDFSSGARIANVIDPTTATISKAFSPNPASINGVSALTITLTNPNGGALSGYNFVDNLPANLVVASPNSATTSGCGTPTLTATAGSSTISFSNGTLAANGTCIIKVNVTPSATGSLVNTTNDLFIDTVDTGHSATATLTVNNSPPPGTGLCGVTMANWSVPNGTTANPPDLTGGVPTVKAANVATATLAANVPASTSINTSTGHTDTTSWNTFGYKTAGQFVQFTLDTTNYTGVQMSFWVANPSAANGPAQITVAVNSGAGFGAPVLTINSPATAFTQHTIDLTGLTNTSGNTLIRIAATGAANDNSGASLVYDDMVYSGCTSPVQPTISKVFVPSSIAVNAVSTLTFSLTNTNAAALTGAAFTDALPAGVQVAATPAAATTCGGTWAPAAGNTTLSFSGGTIPASSSCTVSVNVTATTAGPHDNISGVLSTTESGTNVSSVASATLTALSPPQISKLFAPSPILAGGTSTLTFTLINPNQNDTLSGVAFADTFPTSPGAMVVAAAPNPVTSNCGAPTFSPAGGAGSISFSGGSIAPGGTCLVSVDVTVPVVGTYNNTSGNVSHIINAQTVNGNTASASLTVDPPHPAIGLLKQVGLSASGPWTPFLAISPPTGVYYQFTIENTGDVPLSPISLADNTLDVSSCNAAFSGLTLPVAVAANNNHIVTCVVGPVATTSGQHTNTATASGTYNATVVTGQSSANYASTDLTLVKSVTETTFTLPGDVLHYSYLVTNNGFAALAGPVTVSDDKATVTCPAVDTVGDLDNFLDPGESITCTATYIVTPTDVANAAVTNTATATADSVNSNQDSRTVPLSTSADVSIDKTLITVGPYSPGQSISYTLVVANAGPSTATSIQVTDTPTNLTITNVSGSGCTAFPCTIASLASGANTTINVTATINAAGAFDNSATATAVQPDPNTNNNTDNTGNGGTATASADVSIVKTLTTPGPYFAGQSLSYTLVVANAGPSTATSIQVTDTPTNLTITNVSGSSCSALPCTIASLASGANTTINVTATINAAGAFDNTATANAVEFDPDTSNNTDSTGNGGTAAPSADVSIVKTLTTAGPYLAGQSINYSLVVANAGPSTATSIQVTDTPTNMTITNVSGGSCSALPCTIASLAAGANTTITVTATINAAGVFSNTATANGAESDPNTGNNTDTKGSTAGASADLAITKTDGTGSYTPGATTVYTIVATNNGPSDVTGATIADALGASFTADTWTATATGGATGFSASGSGDINDTVDMPAGSTITYMLSATISLAATGNVSNTATITVPAGVTDLTPGNNSATDTDTNGGTPQLTISKTATPSAFAVGQNGTYSLLVSNTGTTSTSGAITVADTLPSGITTTALPSGTNWDCSASTSTAVSCTTSAVLLPGENAPVISVPVAISLSAVSPSVNTATVSGGSDFTCPAPHCSSTISTPVDAPLINLSKVLQGNLVVGVQTSYVITATNNGQADTLAGTITDAVPAGLTLGTLPSGCNATGQNLTCTLPAGIATGSSVSYTILVTPQASLAGTSVVNSATVNGGGDPSCPAASHCSDTSSGTVTAPQLNLTKSATPSSFVVNQPATYTLTLTNTGTAATTAVTTITDAIPGGLTIGTLPSACSAVGQTVTCTIAAPLNTGAPVSFDIPVTPTNALNGNSVTNTAGVTGGGDPGCIDGTPVASLPARCVGSVTDAVSAPQLTLQKSANTASFVVGVAASYTLQVTNTGSSQTNSAATISDNVPSSLTLGLLPSGCSAAGQQVTCTIASGLATGTSVSFVIPVTPTAGSVPSVSNTATVQGGGDPTCPVAANCSSGVTTPVNAPQLTILKTASASNFVVGTAASYTLQITNTGTAATTATATITDNVPSTLTLGALPAGCTAAGQTVTCTIAAGLATGGNTSFVIPVTPTPAADGTTLTNTATVSGGGDPSCPGGSNCSSSTTTPVDAPALQIVKTASASNFLVGVAASYTLQVTNIGTAATTASATISDNIPSTLTIGSVPAGCTAVGHAVTCTIAAGLATGSPVSFVIPVTPTAAASGTTLSNTAKVSGGGDPSCPAGPNCSSTVNTPVDAPALQIVKTPSASNFVVGVAASYTLQITNVGSAATTAGITVSDTVPGSLTIGTLPAGCTASGQAVTCTIAAGLATNAPVSFVIPVTPTAAASGTTLTNTATVSGGGDPTCPAGPNCSSTVVTPVNAPALQIVKTASASNFVVGVAASYTLQVTNIGSAPTTATTTLSDSIPSALTIGALPAGCTGSGQLVTCTVAAGLATNAPVSFVIPVTATAAAIGTSLSNTATVSGGGDPTCPAGPNCTSTVVTPVNAPALQLVKTASASNFVVGVAASYTLQATNIGSAPTTATTTISDNVPSTLAIGALPPGCTGSGQLVTCTIAAGLATNAPVSFTIPVTATAAANGTTLVNTATVSGGGDTSCPSNSNPNCSSTVTTPVGAPALQIVKTASSSTFTVNVAASYTLTVTNIGGAATTTTATLSDNVPGTLTLGTLPGGCTASGQQVSCTIASGLAANASASFVIPVTPTAAASGTTLINTAIVSGGGDPSCPGGANCSSSISTPVTPTATSADLQIVKTGPASVTAGQNVVYTITVTSIGPDTAVAAVLSDLTPAGLTFFSSGAPCPTFPCNLGNIAANQSITISNVIFHVPANYAGSSIVNVASVTSSTPDPTPNNNTSTVSTTVSPVPQTVVPTPIDARWMLIAMLLMLMTAGAYSVRKRQ